jgi:hypothetical protein
MTQRLQKDLSEFSFQILNTTSATQQMYFLSNPSNTQDISNQHTEYSWDITSIANNLGIYDLVTIEARNANSGQAFITYSAPILSPTISGIVTALNTLQIASFYYEVIGGNTYIRTYNDSLELGQLNIINTNAATFGLFYSVAIPFAFTGDGDTQIVSTGTFDTGLLVNPQTIPTTNATSLVALTETVTVSGVTPSIGTSIICAIRVLIDETIGASTTNLSDETFYGVSFNATPFTLSDANGTYNITVQYPNFDANYYIATSSTDGNVSIDWGQASVPIWFNPQTRVGDFTTQISSGQLVQVYGNAPNSGAVLTVRVRIRKQDVVTGVVTTISDNTYSSGAAFNNSFNAVTGYGYQILVTDV